MFTSEFNTRSKADIRKEVQRLSIPNLLKWLGDPTNSTRPELYADLLPSGIEFMSLPTAESCVDFVSQNTGLDSRDVRPTSSHLTQDTNGNLIFYNIIPNGFYHTGLVKNGIVTSQWSQGAVLKHKINMVPDYWLQGKRGIYRIR